MGGLEGPPNPPGARQRPGEAVALLDPPGARPRGGEAVALLDSPGARPRGGEAVALLDSPGARPRGGEAVALLDSPGARQRGGEAVALLDSPGARRQALGLKPGQALDIRAGDGRLEIEIASTPMQLKKRGKGLVAVPEAKLPPLTAEQVRDALERVRR